MADKHLSTFVCNICGKDVNAFLEGSVLFKIELTREDFVIDDQGKPKDEYSVSFCQEQPKVDAQQLVLQCPNCLTIPIFFYHHS